MAKLAGPVGGTPGPSPTRPNRRQVPQRRSKWAKTPNRHSPGSGFCVVPAYARAKSVIHGSGRPVKLIMANNYPDATALSTVEARTTPGIYTFLGLATLPRMRTPANNLRILPREMIQRIARFAHRVGYLACWAVGDVLATKVDMTDVVYSHNGIDRLTMSRPLRRRVTYVEVTFQSAWYGTGRGARIR